jgi:hypothetical protein
MYLQTCLAYRRLQEISHYLLGCRFFATRCLLKCYLEPQPHRAVCSSSVDLGILSLSWSPTVRYHEEFCLLGHNAAWSVGRRPPLWSSGQSSWPQIQRRGFDSRRYQIFWEVEGLKRGPLRLVSTTEELLGRKSSGSGLEIREYGRRDPSR